MATTVLVRSSGTVVKPNSGSGPQGTAGAAGATGPAGAGAADQAFNQSARLPIVYDDFDRADGNINGTAAASGQVWAVGGPGAATAHIIDGALYGDDAVANSNFYPSLQYGAQITFLGGVVRFENRGNAAVTGEGPQVVLIAQTVGLGLSDMLHCEFFRNAWSLKIRTGSGTFDPIGGASYEMLADTDYGVGMQIDKANNRCRVFISGPGLVVDSGWITEARIGTLALVAGTWQIQTVSPTNNTYKPSWRAVTIGPPKRGLPARSAGIRSGEWTLPFIGPQPSLIRMPRFTASANGYYRAFSAGNVGGYSQVGRLHIHASGTSGTVRASYSVFNNVGGGNPTISAIDVQQYGLPIGKIRVGNDGATACSIDFYFPNAATFPVIVDTWFEGIASSGNFGVALAGVAALTNTTEITVAAPPPIEAGGAAATSGWYSVASASSAISGYVLADTFEIDVVRNDGAGGERVIVSAFGIHNYRLADPIIHHSAAEGLITAVRISRGAGAVRLDVNLSLGAAATITVRRIGGIGFSTLGPVASAASALATESKTATVSATFNIARDTGWVAPTGTATKATFDTATVTLPQLAQAVKALIDAGLAAKVIGA